MRAVVLDSFVGSRYRDDLTSYEFPARYLRHFEPLRHGEPLFAVIYEPRGNDNKGRMAFVGWASITEPPERVASGYWRVQYAERVYDFDRPVPREWLGEPIESFLRELPRGRQRNIATFGRAVRPITPGDLHRILELAYGGEVDPLLKYPDVGEIALPEATLQERTRRLVEVIQRDARFRDDVFVTYDFRCAISQFAAGRIAPSRLGGLLEAAHLRPVRYSGPDLIANGLALTPTLHRLFDAGLFTLRYRDGHLEVETSPALEEPMIKSPDGDFRLPLVTGHRAHLPADGRKWPHPDFLQYHQAEVFVSGSS